MTTAGDGGEGPTDDGAVTDDPADRRKPPGRFHHGDLRRALIDTAAGVVAQQGAEAVSLRDLARRLGVNHRAVYRHFADRDDLLVTVAVDGWHLLGAEVEAARAAATDAGPGGPVEAMLGAYVTFAMDHGGHYGAMLGPGSATVEDHPELRTAALEAIRVVEREVAAQTGSSGAAVRDRVFALWGLAHGLCDLMLRGHARVASTARARAWVVSLARPLLDDAHLR